MKKKILLAVMLVLLGVFAFGMVSASAETYGYLTYSVSGGKVTITDCDTSASGNLVIPDKLGGYPVTSIGEYAFYDCSRLVSITIGNGVTSIGESAFHNCSRLVSIAIGNGVTSIGDYAFNKCSSLVSVTIGNGVTSIGNAAFYNCSSLVSITIPDSVTSIGDWVFSSCSRLVSIAIGNGVTSIGEYAFEDCDSLESITIPDSVTSIGDYAFSSCSSLARVDITDIEAWCRIKFTSYSSNPLSYAGNLYLNGNLVTELVIPDGVTSIGDYAFEGCSSLESITIPDSVTSIGYCAFDNCSSLVSITIPDSVTSIGFGAFSSCSSLESITIPDSVTSIGDSAFSSCSRLVSITIGNGVTTIGECAFSGCSSLTSVFIPESVEIIEASAFYGCGSIENVFYGGSEDEWNKILFYQSNGNLTNAKMFYNAQIKTYKFETNCDAKLSDITDYAIFTMPTVKNDGLTLTGWYDNAALSGEAVTFPYFGDAATLYAAWTARTGKTFEDAFVAKANQQYTGVISTSGEYVYYEFVPTASKKCNFYTTGSKDTYGYLYNSSKKQISSDDDSGEGNNFYISYNLTAGQTYYIAVKLYSGTGSFNFFIEEPVDYKIEELTIKDKSGKNLSSIPAAEFLASVSFTNVSSSEDTVIVLAQYSSSGEFKGLIYVNTKNMPVGTTIQYTLPVDNKTGDITQLKAFCWESFESAKPVGNSVSFPAE